MLALVRGTNLMEFYFDCALGCCRGASRGPWWPDCRMTLASSTGCSQRSGKEPDKIAGVAKNTFGQLGGILVGELTEDHKLTEV